MVRVTIRQDLSGRLRSIEHVIAHSPLIVDVFDTPQMTWDIVFAELLTALDSLAAKDAMKESFKTCACLALLTSA